ncbi:MAG: hypothetical protein SNJ28_05915 [Rikenellaceae bacterium]
MNIFKKLFGLERVPEKVREQTPANENSISFSPFVFKSNQHQRYEQGNAAMGEQNCIRTISVEKNNNGCKGYKLEPRRGYIVKIYNDDLGKPNMSDKPMDLISLSEDKAVFRGFPIEAMSPFGWQEVDYRDYGLTVHYTNGEVSKCVLHMYDRNIDMEYRLSKSVAPKNNKINTTIPATKESIFRKNISFTANRYEEWQQGMCISSGNISTTIIAEVQSDKIHFVLDDVGSIRMNKQSTYLLAASTILADRIQYANSSDFDPNTPIICHIFFEGGKVSYIRFAMTNPDRIVEFYGELNSVSEPKSTSCYNKDTKEVDNQGVSKEQIKSMIDVISHIQENFTRIGEQNGDALQSFQLNKLLDQFKLPLLFAWQRYKYGWHSDFWEEGESMIEYMLFEADVENSISKLQEILYSASPFKMIERDGLITKGLLIIYSQILSDLRNNLIKI